MRLKLFALSGAAVILWVAPLHSLDKKIAWHRAIQGVSLIGAFACAIEASRVAQKLTKEEALSHAKEALLISDIQDELAQSAYLSEQERKIQNQHYLESLTNSARSNSDDVERLERSLALTRTGERSNQNGGVPLSERLERIQELLEMGWSKAKIIQHIWGVSKGGSAKYKAAESEYEELISQMEDEE
ncbi:MAG: hypothetical protein ACM37W_23010 [Actinomycetota bacterium]